MMLDYIRKEEWPLTTEMIAKEFKISWNTAQMHLLRMQAEGRVKGKRVGRHNEWMVVNDKRQKPR